MMTTPRIYVGTYGKYNEGSIAGAWLELDDYSDKAEFYEACAELHKDESDPEFMFQDWEGAPEGMIGESWVADDLWEWIELDDDDKLTLQLARACHCHETTIEQARDAYQGAYESEAHFAESFADDMGELPESNWLVIDWEATWNASLRFDYTSIRHEGEVYIFRFD